MNIIVHCRTCIYRVSTRKNLDLEGKHKGLIMFGTSTLRGAAYGCTENGMYLNTCKINFLEYHKLKEVQEEDIFALSTIYSDEVLLSLLILSFIEIDEEMVLYVDLKAVQKLYESIMG